MQREDFYFAPPPVANLAVNPWRMMEEEKRGREGKRGEERGREGKRGEERGREGKRGEERDGRREG